MFTASKINQGDLYKFFFSLNSRLFSSILSGISELDCLLRQWGTQFY
jgi:hypothetical protein